MGVSSSKGAGYWNMKCCRSSVRSVTPAGFKFNIVGLQGGGYSTIRLAAEILIFARPIRPFLLEH